MATSTIQRVATMIGTFAAAVVASENASRFILDPILPPWLVSFTVWVGMAAAIVGAVVALRSRDISLGLLAAASAAALALPGVSALAAAPVAEVVRSCTPAALATGAFLLLRASSRAGRVTHLALFVFSTAWLVGLVTPGPLGLFLSLQIIALWIAFCIVARPAFIAGGRVLATAWQDQAAIR